MTDIAKETKYIAFISYRHKDPDRKAAIAIQKMIERYKVPKELHAGSGVYKLGKVFRDEDELPASSSLTDSIRFALDNTEFLIVICSPDLPKSKWCEEEIRYFLSTHDRDHVLAVLVSGEPQESFSPLLLHEYDKNGAVIRDVEPIAANITGTPERYSRQKFTKEITRICAALIGCSFDELWQRERRYKTRRRAVIAGIAFLGMSVFAITIGLKNLRIRAQNDEISRQNIEISQKNTELRIREGKLLVESGRLMIDENDRTGAAEKALQAMNIEGVHTDGAELLLNEANCRFCIEDLRLDLAADQESTINRCIQSSDASLVFTSDQYGSVRAYKNRVMQWSYSAVPSRYSAEYMDRGYVTSLYLTQNDSILLIGNAYGTAGLSASDGKVLWSNLSADPVDFISVSDDGSLFAVFNDFDKDYVSVHSSADGSEIIGFYLPDMGTDYYSHYDFSTYTLGRNFGGSFSADGRYFMFGACIRSYNDSPTVDPSTWIKESVPGEVDEMNGYSTEGDRYSSLKDLLIYCVIDIEEKAAWMAGKEPVEFGLNTIFGLSYLPETDSLLFARHDEAERSTYSGVFDNEGMLCYILKTSDIRLNSTKVPWSYCDGATKVTISSADNLYLLDKPSLAYIGRYELGSNIIHTSWVDRDHDVLFALEDSGTYHVYPISAENETTTYMINGDLNMDSLVSASVSDSSFFKWNAAEAKTEINKGRLILLSSDSPGRAVTAELFTDKKAYRIASDLDLNRLTRIVSSSDASKLFVIRPDISGPVTVAALNTSTMELVEQHRFESVNLYSGEPVSVLGGGEYILYKGALYKEGSEKQFFEYSEDFSYYLTSTYADMTQTLDGTVLTAFITQDTNGYDHIYTWKNESAFLTFSMGDGTSLHAGTVYGSLLRRGTDTLLKTGRNGYIISGIRKTEDLCFTGYFLIDNVGNMITVESEGGAMPWSSLTISNKGSLFAVIEEDGVLRIYDAEAEECILSLRDNYGFSGAVDIAFSSKDDIVGVLFYNGTIKLYSVNSGEHLINDTDVNLATNYGKTSLEIIGTKDGSHIIVRALESTQMVDCSAAVYDIEARERVADITNYAAYSEENNSVIMFEDVFSERRYFACPLAN